MRAVVGCPRSPQALFGWPLPEEPQFDHGLRLFVIEQPGYANNSRLAFKSGSEAGLAPPQSWITILTFLPRQKGGAFIWVAIMSIGCRDIQPEHPLQKFLRRLCQRALFDVHTIADGPRNILGDIA